MVRISLLRQIPLLAMAGMLLSPVLSADSASPVLEKRVTPSNILRVEPAHETVHQSASSVSAPPTTEPEQAVPDTETPSPAPAPPSPTPTAFAPDEAALWAMLQQRQFGALLAAVRELRTTYPEWKPPSRMIMLAETGLREASIRSAIAANDSSALLLAESRHPELFSCEHVDWAWAAAEAAVALQLSARLDTIFARLIPDCRPADRLATLQKARNWLTDPAWDALVRRESAADRPTEIESEFQTLLYGAGVQALVAASQTAGLGQFALLLSDLADRVIERRDTGTALLAGWSFLQQQDTAAAAMWFGKAHEWEPLLADPLHGLALCALQSKQYADARDLAWGLPESKPERAALLREATIGLAQAAAALQNPTQALELFTAAEQYGDLPRYARLGAAWAHFQSGDPHSAADRFRALYNEAPDDESADGLLNSLVAAHRERELDVLAITEPLATLVRAHRARNAFSHKRFLLAGDLAPDTFAQLGSAGSPRATWYGALRDKSGQPGLSRLQDTVQSAEAAWPLDSRSEIRVRVDSHFLDSGGLDRGSRDTLSRSLLVGALGFDDAAPNFDTLADAAAGTLRIDGVHGHVSGVEPLLSWRRESSLDLEAAIGLRLAGGSVGSQPIGRISLQQHLSGGNYRVALFVRPIRESILSYTGMRLDNFLPATPFNGRTWGAVRGSGIEGSGYKSLPHGFSVSGRVAAEHIDGKRVRDNDHAAATLNVGRDLGIAGMDYTVAGVSASYDHYDHNSSHFTPGHGGYFSPQTFWQAKATLDFQTAENRQAMVKGHFDGGRAFKREATAPMVPLDGFSDFGSYAGSRTWGWTYTAELHGAIRLSDHVQLGASFSRRESPQYDESAGLLFLRVLFEPRQAVLSTDLPGAILEEFR